MSKLSYRVSYYVLYALFAVIVVVLGLFYFGGDGEPLGPELMQNPIYTDALLYLMYGLLGLTIVLTVGAFIVQFGGALKDNPMAAIKSLLGVVLLVIVMVVAWSMGSEETLVLQGYDGNENVPFWLKLSDMFLYTLYFLIAACIVAILGSSIKKALQ
ncbi:hypothetical protein [Bacteroides sp. 51]|uniref:hypothetical protein n=1 Tax=Bacteroides sp. 51 TaxID=2302938 RepID=UPI0013D22BD4|nr:hypothetical protein [Bacteroides sp. 51]NDV82424.1 hypothetical protein [Bacteroides sp. 51]